MKNFLVSAAFVGVLMSASVAHASVTVYSDRVAFTAATGANSVETFTNTAHFPLSSGVLNSSSSEAGLLPGQILPGVTYSTPVGSDNFFNIDSGGGYEGGFLDTVNGPRVLTVTFDSLQSGFGFDANRLMGDFTVNIFGEGGSALGNFSYPSANGLTFFGFGSSAVDIRSATIAGTDGTFGFALDNFTFNTNTVTPAVPEPATWAMMLVGFGLVGSAMRRRQKVTVNFA